MFKRKQADYKRHSIFKCFLDVRSYYHSIGVKADICRLSALEGKRSAISKGRLASARCDTSDYERTYAPCMLILMEREITPITGDVNFSCRAAAIPHG